jgi:hypothetical protein
MLRAFSLALTLMIVTPAVAVESPADATVAQQKAAPPPPRHDCQKSSEGIS